MAPIVIDRLSPQALAELERRAAARHRSVAEELIALVEQSVGVDPATEPGLRPAVEDGVPYDLPWSGPVGSAKGAAGPKQYPDPVFFDAPAPGELE